MAIHAYNEIYLEGAQKNLAVMLDFAVKFRKENADEFFHKFISSEAAHGYESGNPAFLLGSTGVDLYRSVVGDYAGAMPEYISFSRTPEYWVGSAVAYCQWFTTRSFFEIVLVYPISEMIKDYPAYKDKDLSLLVDEVEKRIRRRPTNLEYFRSQAGLSQSELASLSGVDIRSIQMYEQRRNDISHAQFNIVSALAAVLGCDPVDLTDKNNFRLAAAIDPRYAVELFTRQLMTELNRKQRSTYYPDFRNAQIQSRMYFYGYGYLNVFPFHKLSFANGVYTIERSAFIENWNAYWLNLAERKRENVNLKERKLQLLKKTGESVMKNDEILAADLALAVVAAMSCVESAE